MHRVLLSIPFRPSFACGVFFMYNCLPHVSFHLQTRISLSTPLIWLYQMTSLPCAMVMLLLPNVLWLSKVSRITNLLGLMVYHMNFTNIFGRSLVRTLSVCSMIASRAGRYPLLSALDLSRYFVRRIRRRTPRIGALSHCSAQTTRSCLKSVISSVVSPVQTCGIPGRFSGETVRLLQDIVNYSNGHDALISLDQEKALTGLLCSVFWSR